ncbi:MAG TPA: NAD-dependent epimerase/dehydratase family protein [Gemmataceae bacterium]|jgi:dihydroflavonol-4-reductase|nr:NAD-dependent epimerase/dehydratase family protein [Gemmataceae bacterium]
MQPDPRFWSGRRVCVTGGTGFLGIHLVMLLQSVGAAVRVFALPPAVAHPLMGMGAIEAVWGDLLDSASVRRAVAGCDVVFHTAGTVAVWGPALARLQDVHVLGTRHVVDAAGGARVVHTSSIVAVGASRREEVFTESDAFPFARLRVPYVRAKRAAEELVLGAAAAGQDVVVVNPGYLLGPEDYEPSAMGRFCIRAWKGRVILSAPGGYNFVDVRDVAAGHLLAAERGERGRRYILGGENLRMPEFLRRLAAVARLRPRAIPVLPVAGLWLAAAIAEGRAKYLTGREPYPAFQHVRVNRYDWFCSSERAERELDYRARPLDETLRDTHRWFAERGRVALRGFGRWWMRPSVAA